MSLASVFDTLGQSVMPRIATAVFPDTMTIVEDSLSAGTGGGQIKTTSNYKTGVPCAYEPRKSQGTRRTEAERNVSTQLYDVTLATHQSGSRINLDPAKHKFVVDARGNEPSKTFHIRSVDDESGVIFVCVCEREN